MMRSKLTPILAAIFFAVAAPMAVSANQMPQSPPNPSPVDQNEPRFYEQFDCENINTLTEWKACTEPPEV